MDTYGEMLERTERAGAAADYIVNPVTGSLSTRDQEGEEFRAYERLGEARKAASRDYEFLTDAGWKPADASEYKRERMAEAEARFDREMNDIAAKYAVKGAAVIVPGPQTPALDAQDVLASVAVCQSRLTSAAPARPSRCPECGGTETETGQLYSGGHGYRWYVVCARCGWPLEVAGGAA